MRFQLLATDYDGTIAEHGHVTEPVWTAIRLLRKSNRKVVLVTGRELVELQTVCTHLELFDRVVAENGALIYEPQSKAVQILEAPPSSIFVASLAARGVTPLSVGHVIVATTREYESVVRATIQELALDLRIIFNQDSLMVLPASVNKATGLELVLHSLGISLKNTVAVGDAENDIAMISACGCGVAIGNGVPALRARADFVTRGNAGAGVIELIEEMVADDLQNVMARRDSGGDSQITFSRGTPPDG